MLKVALIVIGALVLIAVGVIAYLWFFVADHRPPEVILEAEDGQDPVRRWTRAAFAMVNGQWDFGRPENGRECTEVLKDDWGVTTREQLLTLLDELAAAPSGCVAWDHVRRIIAARLGGGATLLTQPESFERVQESFGPLRRAYADWEAMGEAYRAHLVAWAGDRQHLVSGFDFNRDEIARRLWAVVPFAPQAQTKTPPPRAAERAPGAATTGGRRQSR